MSLVDLTEATTIVEQLMDDECVITRNAVGTRDETVNEVSGRREVPAGQPTTVYTGKCKMRNEFITATTREGGQDRALTRYVFGIPISAPTLRAGDLVKITVSKRDAAKVGQTFRVIEPTFKTFAVQKRFNCELRQPREDLP